MSGSRRTGELRRALVARGASTSELEVPLGQREKSEPGHRQAEQRVADEEALAPREGEEQQAHEPVVGRHDGERVERGRGALVGQEMLTLPAGRPAKRV